MAGGWAGLGEWQVAGQAWVNGRWLDRPPVTPGLSPVWPSLNRGPDVLCVRVQIQKEQVRAPLPIPASRGQSLPGLSGAPEGSHQALRHWPLLLLATSLQGRGGDLAAGSP